MWKKRMLAGLLALAAALSIALPAAAQEGEQPARRFAQPDFDVPCRAAMLICRQTGEVLYEKNADQQMPIASITKVMTLMLTFDALAAGKVSLQDIVPVSTHAYNMGGSQIWLEPGEQFTLDEMIKAICVASANDAAVAVAEFIGGSELVFAGMMNEKAAQLGMTGTVYKNACGLDEEGHLSTARDVATLSRAMLNAYPQVTEYTTIWMDSLRGGATQLVNTNKLLQRYSGINGLKTGTTSGAGVCISASASRDGLDLIAVVLGANSSAERFDTATALLDYGFANFELAACPQPQDAPASLPVERGVSRQVTLQYPQGEGVLVKKGDGAGLSVTLELPQKLTAPIAQGQEIGRMVLAGQEGQLGSWPVTAGETVEAISFASCLEILYKSLITL